jgi:hypothetical protein
VTLERTVPTEPTNAVRIRDWAHVLTPLAAGVFILIATATDPAPGIDGPELARRYAENPTGLAIHALTLHFGFGLWIATGLLAARLVRGRGAWLANVAVALGFLGITTLPGLMFSDFFTSAITAELGEEGYTTVADRMDSMWGVGVFVLQGMPGAALAPLLGAVALASARVLPWWSAGVVLLATATLMAFANASILGAVALVGILGVYSWTLFGALIRDNGKPSSAQAGAGVAGAH